ncbi:hypothetical protein BJ165DRAFT_1402013 [Panaeolus papilionaceus]|nr:hypothetical protein BJ165DRAFT_1402013 [Panaeolus papilionaceus]
MSSISTLNPPIAMLPLELVLRIMENLNPYEDKSTFCSLSLVGRPYRSAAQRGLFYTVDFAFFFLPSPIELYWVYDHKRDTEVTPAKKFLRSIATDPSLAQAVKHFRIALHLRYRSNFQSPAYMHSNALTEILDALPCLQSLEVDSLSYLGWYWFKGQAKRSIEGKLRSSPSIRRVVMKGITALPPFLLCYANNLHTLVLSSTLTEEDRISESIHQYRPG